MAFISGVNAQDPQFTQFYAAPLYLNPGFTGNTQMGRAMANYRNQWPGISSHPYVSYSIGYDHNLREINSGVGLLVMHDKAGTGGLRYTSVGGSYSYNIQVSRDHYLVPGVQMSYVQKDLDFSELIFRDQLATGNPTSIEAPNLNQKAVYLDVSTGVVHYTKDYWVGIAAHHLNQPDQSLLGDESRLPMKFSFHGGYNIPIKQNIKGIAKSTVTPAFIYKFQNEFDQIDIGAYYYYKPLVVGLWYRGIPLLKSYEPGYQNNDAVAILVGYEVESIRIGYSYDITISRLIANSHGSHEIAIIYEYATKNSKRKKNRQKILIPCAKF